MKKLLKISATALIIAGANMLFSQSALACDPAQGTGQCSNIGGYGNVNSGGYSGTQHKYIGLAWTKDDKPFFYNTTMITAYYNPTPYDWEMQDYIFISRCNQSSQRSPCRKAFSMTNGCIAIAQVGEMMYADGGATCKEAKQKAIQWCQIKDSNPNACKIYRTKRS
ncbi:DUF4189 domain-containing protein [Moraxella oblonga]|uniref:DUF4189 domain-containing protein n=1 Tax=Moraxella oblonga TaxID=200413 RepID=UPI00082DDF9B|nr:DUF4189 domain-containing protein [Moraxella oblonga]